MKITRELNYDDEWFEIEYYYEPAQMGDNYTAEHIRESVEITSVNWTTMDTVSGNTCKVNVYPIIHADDILKMELLLIKKHKQ